MGGLSPDGELPRPRGVCLQDPRADISLMVGKLPFMTYLLLQGTASSLVCVRRWSDEVRSGSSNCELAMHTWFSIRLLSTLSGNI
jgi:hypothetical protein